MYREFTIDELDEEVVSLVKSMNTIKHIKTVSSCSGHDRRNLWVDFTCDDFNTLNLFLNLFNYDGDFKYDWNVVTNYKLTTTDKNLIALELRCKHRGKKAYECAEKLSKYLKDFGEYNG